MTLLTLQDISLAFGPEALFDKANLVIQQRERICIIGRNGAGKSSLLKIIEGTLQPDEGKVIRAPQLRIAKLQQDIPIKLTGTVYDCVAEGLDKQGTLLKRYHAASLAVSKNKNHVNLNLLQQLQSEIEATDSWNTGQQIDRIISTLQLNPDDLLSNLSGGILRRVLLAKALVSYPDILLLDEPTNHLDIDAIEWLENFLLGFKKTLIFITHDRNLVKHIATRIVEVDYGKLYHWECTFDEYQTRKAAQIIAQEKEQQLFDKRLAAEEKWIRKGIQARRTRNEGRVRKLLKMRQEKMNRRKALGTVKLEQHMLNDSGKKVFSIHKLCYACNEKPIIKNFSLQIQRGDKIGIIGKNGIGKSTLLKLLLGDLQPDRGTIKRGTHLSWSYFDQKRQRLDESLTVIDNICEEGEYVVINGQSKHIITYLRDFLFTPERARTPVKALSGGERNRLLLARLFMHPHNLLILDEPTNDLDAETLELLEEKLIDYQGTLLLVSHDRSFINNIVTSTLAFLGNGQLQEYVGGYDDYLRQRPALPKNVQKTSTSTKAKRKIKKPSHKLSFKEKYELENLPQKIELLEKEQRQLVNIVSKGDFYQQPANFINQTNQALTDLQKNLEIAYKRWETLEEKQNT